MIFQQTNTGAISPFWSTESINRQDQIGIDIESLWKYKEAMDGGATTTDALAVFMGKASESAKQLALSTELNRKSINDFRRAEESTIGSTKKYSSALTGLKSIAKTVGVSLMNMGAIMVASVAINKTIEIIGQLNSANEIAIEKAKELASAWEESDSALRENKKTLDGISAEYAKLSKGVDSFGKNVSLTSDEYSRYSELSNQIADMFPELVSGWTSEGNAILNVKGSVEELTEAYENARKAANEAIVGGAHEVFTGFKSFFSGSQWYGSNAKEATGSHLGLLNSLRRYASGDEGNLPKSSWEDLLVSYFSSSTGGKSVSDEIGVTVNTIDDLIDNFRKFDAYRVSLESQMNLLLDPVKKSIMAGLEGVESYSGFSDEVKSIVSVIVSSFDSAFYSEFDKSVLAQSWFQENLIDQLAGFDLDKIIGRKSLFDTGEISLGNYQDIFDSFKAAISEFEPEIQEALIDTFSPDTDILVSNITNKLSDGWEKVKTLTFAQLKIAAGLDIGEAIPWDSLFAQITDAQLAESYSIETLASRIKSLTQMYESLDTAISEQAESGAMSYETYTKLISANEDFADSISIVEGRLYLNADAAYDAADAYTKLQQAEAEAGAAAKKADLDENADALEKINGQLRDIENFGDVFGDQYKDLSDQRDVLEAQRDELDGQLRQYQAITSEIEAMYGAYIRFKKAQSTPNQGAVYDSGAGEMKETLKGGVKSKALNTDEVKSAIDFFVGEGDESQAGLKKRSKKAKEIADRYFTEKDPLVGLNRFQKDLLNKNKMGELSGSITKDKDGKLQIADGVEAQDIADQLGMSLEAVKSMFDKWEEYDADADWDSLYEKLYPKEPETSEEEDSALKVAADKITDDTVLYEEAMDAAIKAATDKPKDLADALAGKTPSAETPTPSSSPTTSSTGSSITTPSILPAQVINLVLDLSTEETGRVEGLIKGIDGEIPIEADSADVELVLSSLGVSLENLPDGTVTITMDDTNGAVESVESMSDALELIRAGANVKLTITLPEGSTQEDIDALNASLESLPEEVRSIIIVDASNVPDAVSDANAELEKVADKEAKIKADASSIPGDVSQANEALSGVEDQNVVIDANTGYITGDVEKVKGELESIPDVDVEITADASTVPDVVQDVKDDLASIQDKNVTATVTYETEGTPPTTPDTNSKFKGGGGGTSGTGGGRNTTPKQSADSTPAEIIDSENIVQAQEQLNIFQAIWRRILGLFSGDEYVVPDLISPTAIDGVSQAEVGINALQAKTIDPKSVTLDTATAYSQNTQLENRLDDPVTKEVRVVTTGATYASGTKKAKPGLAMVDDGVGANAGAEAILRNDGTVEFGTSKGPRLTVLQGGEQVLDAKETRNVLRRSQSGGAVLPRLASGTLPSPVSSSYKNTSSSKKNTAKKVNWNKYVDRLFDWIEIRLERLSFATDQWMLQIQRAVGYLSKNQYIDAAVKSITERITTLETATNRYMEQAAVVAKKMKLSQDVITKIQNGSIDITLYSSNMQKKIKEYQEWYEKARDAAAEVENLKDQQQELIHQKMDNIIAQYDNLAKTIENAKNKAQSAIDLKVSSGKSVNVNDYAPVLAAQQALIDNLRKEQADILKEFNKQVGDGSLVTGSDAWYNYKDAIESLDAEINNATIDLNELNDAAKSIVLTNLSHMLTALQATQSSIEQTLSLIEAQGRIASSDSYVQLVEIGMEQIANLKTQNEELRKQQIGLDRNSDKYQEIQVQLDENLASIGEIMASQEEWNDTIADLKINAIQRYRDELEKTNDTYKRQIELQEAQEALERAKTQRRVRTYVEGQGFVWQESQKDVQDAARALEEKQHDETLAKLDDLIDAIEDTKAENNVYAGMGSSPNTFTPIDLSDLFEGLDESALSDFYSSINSALVGNNIVSQILDTSKLAGLSRSAAMSNVASVNIDKIDVYESSDANAVVEAIAENLGTQFIRQVYK